MKYRMKPVSATLQGPPFHSSQQLCNQGQENANIILQVTLKGEFSSISAS